MGQAPRGGEAAAQRAWLREMPVADAAKVMGSRQKLQQVLSGADPVAVVNRGVPEGYRTILLGDAIRAVPALDREVDEFTRRALQNRSGKQAPLVLGAVPASFAAKAAAAIDKDIASKQVALDHDYVLHLFDIHGVPSELLRGQVPVSAKDLGRLPALMSSESTQVVAGDPPMAKNGAPRLFVRSLHEGQLVEFALEVRRRFVVPVTMWKRRRK